jgi:hypothetical protein
MKIVQKIVVAFVFILWSANVAAFDVEGISYEVLSESERTACVARQMFQTNWSAVCCYEFIKLNTSAW